MADPSDPLSLESLQISENKEGLGTFTSSYSRATNTRSTLTPSGRTTTEVFNQLGLTSSFRIGNQAPWTFIYDAKGRLAKLKQSTRVSSFTYNSRGQIASYTDAAGNVTKYTYTLSDRLKTITLPNTKVITFNYDRNGNAVSLLPPNGQQYRYTFDKNDLPVSNLEPIIAGSTYQWNWTYSLDDELTRITHPDLSLLNYTHDPYGRLSTLSGPSISRSYSYDNRGQLSAIQTSDNTLTSFQYLQSLPTRFEWTGVVNGTVGFTWGAHQRLEGISINNQPAVTYQYTPEGEISAMNDLTVTRALTTGLVTATRYRTVRTKTSYNSFGEPISESLILGTNSLFTTNYVRDSLGRIAEINRTEAGSTDNTSYTFDAVGQLLTVSNNGVVTNTYTYDANGNRFTADGAEMYDEQDRLISNSEWDFTHSRNGYLTKKVNRNDGRTIEYSYDNLGNLLTVRS